MIVSEITFQAIEKEVKAMVGLDEIGLTTRLGGLFLVLGFKPHISTQRMVLEVPNQTQPAIQPIQPPVFDLEKDLMKKFLTPAPFISADWVSQVAVYKEAMRPAASSINAPCGACGTDLRLTEMNCWKCGWVRT